MSDQNHTPEPTQQAIKATEPTREAAHTEQAQRPAPKRPADTVHAENVKATIWGRDADKGPGPAFATKISRTYKDENGQLRDSDYLSGADLLRAARVAELAYAREGELKREQALSREARKAQHHEARTQELSPQKSPDRGR